MLRNLRVRNRKVNYRLARRASIISHFQSDIQGISEIFSVTGKRRSNRQLISAVRAGADQYGFAPNESPLSLSPPGEGTGAWFAFGNCWEPSGTVGNRREPCYRFRIRPMT